MGLTGGTSGKEPAYQCGRHKIHRFNPWVRKIPWRKKWQATPVFFPGEFPWTEEPGGLQSIGSQRVGHDWHKMWELDCEESWAQKNWCFWTVVLEKTPESPLDYKEIQPIHSKGDQSWVFIRRTDAEAETPVLWPPDAKSWIIGKDPDAGRDWGQEEKGMTEDEMAGWHHRLDGHEFGWTPGVDDGQGGLVFCDSWGCRESYTTERLNWTEAT